MGLRVTRRGMFVSWEWAGVGTVCSGGALGSWGLGAASHCSHSTVRGRASKVPPSGRVGSMIGRMEARSGESHPALRMASSLCPRQPTLLQSPLPCGSACAGRAQDCLPLQALVDPEFTCLDPEKAMDQPPPREGLATLSSSPLHPDLPGAPHGGPSSPGPPSWCPFLNLSPCRATPNPAPIPGQAGPGLGRSEVTRGARGLCAHRNLHLRAEARATSQPQPVAASSSFTSTSSQSQRSLHPASFARGGCGVGPPCPTPVQDRKVAGPRLSSLRSFWSRWLSLGAGVAGE